MEINRINQTIPYMWGMVIVMQGVLLLYVPSILQGVVLGFSIGMLIGSISYNMAWKLVETYHILTTKMLMQMKKQLIEYEEIK